MTRTDEVRAALDGMGVQHWDDDYDTLCVTTWEGPLGRASYMEWRTGTTRFEARGIDAKGAVSLTFGGDGK